MHNLPPHLAPQPQSLDQGMPLMQGQMSNEEEPKEIVAHFDPEELHYLDETMGMFFPEFREHPSIDPQTGLRDYRPLDNPQILELISEGFSQERQKFAEGGEVTEEGRPTDPELEELRLQGRHGDTELAIITPNLLEKFSEWSGEEPKINPKTGLPEFGGGIGKVFRPIARIAGAVVGGLFGGPVGAAIGGGLATKATGGSWGQALGAGALSGLGAMAAPAIGGFAQTNFPGLSSGLGQVTRGIFGQNIGGALSNMFSPSIGGGMMSPHAVVGANTVGRMLPASAFGQNIAPMAMQAAGQTGGGGFLGSLLGGGGGGGGGLMGGIGQALPLIGSGLLMAKGHREEQKGLRDYQRALEEKEQKEKAEAESERHRMGFYSNLKPVEPYRRRQTNPMINQEEYARGITPYFFENYAQGGAIRGTGKGQQDNIPKNIKENSYIIDASTVSDIGDGSSEAGIKELDRYFNRIPSHGFQHESKGGYIKAMVSDGEYEVPPEKVTAIGHGSNKKGAQVLKKLVHQVRERKRTSGDKLPPKAKPIGGYLKNMGHYAA